MKNCYNMGKTSREAPWDYRNSLGPAEKESYMSTFYDMVWDFWTPKGADGPPCFNCWEPAITLHEIKPKSRYRNWEDDPWNSVPVCHSCHEKIQTNTGGWEGRLTEARNARLQAMIVWKGTRAMWDRAHDGLDEQDILNG